MTLSSDALANVINMLNVGVAVIDENNVITLFSKMAGEMLQQDPEARVGSSILLCHPERAEPGVLKMIEQFRTGELQKYEGFVNFIGRILYEYITPIRDDVGKYLGAIIELHDAKEMIPATNSSVVCSNSPITAVSTVLASNTWSG